MKTKQSEVSEKANASQGGRYAATKKFPVLSLMKLLVKQLAIPLSNQKTVAKWLVIAIRLGCQKTVAKSLVMSKWFALFLFALLSSAQAGESEIRQSLQSKFPNIGKLEHVVKTPYAGLYEVIVNDQLLYTDEQGQYLFDGSVIEVKSRRDMTEERRRQLFAIEFDKLPLDLAVKRVKGNGKRKLAYFSDPNCGFCKRLEKELSKIDNVTLYLFLYPIFQGSDEIVRNVYCAKDPVKAWDGLMLNGIAPVGASCKTPTDKVLALGKKLRVTGTPNLVFGDGMQVPGYLPAEELEKRLGETGKK